MTGIRLDRERRLLQEAAFFCNKINNDLLTKKANKC
ncbi:Uncharacterised protein [Mycobacteroides abscessus subsp. abscessus]|nr:Uncharacterised protein [Mycobacteroides abscessus subsp. abscessus]